VCLDNVSGGRGPELESENTTAEDSEGHGLGVCEASSSNSNAERGCHIEGCVSK
jgi:hypothetical protein